MKRKEEHGVKTGARLPHLPRGKSGGQNLNLTRPLTLPIIYHEYNKRIPPIESRRHGTPWRQR